MRDKKDSKMKDEMGHQGNNKSNRQGTRNRGKGKRSRSGSTQSGSTGGSSNS